MGTRRKSRELALQMLFQADLGQQPADDVRKTFWKGRGDVEREVQGFAEDIFRVAQDRSADIDKLIKAHAANWRIDRMAAVDRNVLRAAICHSVTLYGMAIHFISVGILGLMRRPGARPARPTKKRGW